MWAVVIAHYGQNWGFWTLLTEMASCMNSILKFDLKAVSYNVQFQTYIPTAEDDSALGLYNL
jgi:hypothetical protein